MPEHVLEAKNFCLRLILNVFERDIEYPINTNMTVFVTCNEFSAKTDMDIDVKDFSAFSKKLMAVYRDLKGNASIKEPYGYERFISFVADKTGHIAVKGYLCDDSRRNEMRFETIFDQTYLKRFADELLTTYCGNNRIDGKENL